MITCSACGYDKNPDSAEFCEACGSELQAAPTLTSSSQAPTVVQPETLQPTIPIFPTSTPDPIPTTNARLIAKQPSPPIAEYPLDNNAIIGIFDPDSGPVDIDLEIFSGSETVSRNHAEIYPEMGTWKVKDLGSTNGIFIKPSGQTRFSARITTPQILNSGDEVAFGKVRFLFQTP
ncbi:MAG: FHA domain-containing protein [Sphaerospermopsis sp. SIO1G2]|nr:FHA domain-containing protein [Sphaerospermopsis sp. SIO1G2]